MALYLPGWDEQSVWGYDGLAGYYFAQLYRNGRPVVDDEPYIHLGARLQISSPEDLAAFIAAVTDFSFSAVVASMRKGAVTGAYA